MHSTRPRPNRSEFGGLDLSEPRRRSTDRSRDYETSMLVVVLVVLAITVVVGASFVRALWTVVQ